MSINPSMYDLKVARKNSVIDQTYYREKVIARLWDWYYSSSPAKQSQIDSVIDGPDDYMRLK